MNAREWQFTLNTKKIFVATGLTSLLLLGGTQWMPVSAHDEDSLSQTISTNGHGEVKVKPDSLTLTVATEATGANLNQVRTQTSQEMAKIINTLKGLNIPTLRLKTESVEVYPEYRQAEKSRPSQIVGYRSTNRLSITVEKVSQEQLGEYGAKVLDAALNSGADHVSGIRFFVFDLAPARAEALTEAVKDAARNAGVMAKAANVTITGLYSLEGTPQYGGGFVPMQNTYAMAKSEMAPATPPLETGESTVTSDVTARFKF